MSKNLKTNLWACELQVSKRAGWVVLADLTFDTRAEAREAAAGMRAMNSNQKFPTRVVKYVRGQK